MSLTTAIRSALVLAIIGLAAAYATVCVPSHAVSIAGQEQNAIFAAQRILLGLPLYAEPADFPFVLNQYGPLDSHLIALLARAFRVGPADVHGLFVVGRAISAASTLLAGVALYATATIELGSEGAYAAAAAASLVVLIAPWGFVVRPDALYLSLLAVGIGLGLRYAGGRSRGALAGSAALFLAAAFARQTAAFLLPLPLLMLLAAGGWRALRLPDLLLWAAVCAAGLLFVSQPMIANFRHALGNGISVGYAWQQAYWPVLRRLWPVLVATVLAFTALLRARRWFARPLLAATLWTLALSIVLSLKVGAARNYFDEPLLLAALAIPAALSVARPRRAGAAAHLAGAVLVMGYLLAIAWYDKPFLESALHRRRALYTSGQQAAAVLRRAGTFALPLDFNTILFAPARVAFAPFDVAATAALSGAYDLRPVLAAIDAGRICDAIVSPVMLASLRGDAGPPATARWLPRIGALLLPHFHAAGRIGPALLLLRANSCR